MQKTEMSPDASLRITLEFKGTDKPTVLEFIEEFNPQEIYNLEFESPDSHGQAYARLTSKYRRVRRIL